MSKRLIDEAIQNRLRAQSGLSVLENYYELVVDAIIRKVTLNVFTIEDFMGDSNPFLEYASSTIDAYILGAAATSLLMFADPELSRRVKEYSDFASQLAVEALYGAAQDEYEADSNE